MRKVKKVLSTFLPFLFVSGISLGMVSASIFGKLKTLEAGEDTAVYTDESLVKDYNHPDFRSNDDDDDDEEVTVKVDKVILHYYNEGGGNENRAFYFWVTGVDGVEYNTGHGGKYNPGNIMVVENTNLMTITLDFKSDDNFKEYAGRSGMYFIIKFALKSETDLNWGGQSDDMFIRYADYPNAVRTEGSGQDAVNVCELWTMPAAGGGIAILDSEAKTKVHGVALAQFVDWRNIHCTLTSDTYSVNWKLYAFDQTYFKEKPKKRDGIKKNYLVKEGTGIGDFDLRLKYEAHINLVYQLESHDPSTDSNPDMATLSKAVTVSFDKLYDTTKFHTYYENGDNLGMTYSTESTTFRVWSPIAANMNLLIYDKDTSSEYCGSTDEDTKKAYDKYVGYHMQYTSGGIWQVTVKGNLDGKYYNYQVDNTLGTNVVMDPYATSAGANGLRALIFDINGEKATPTDWNTVPEKWESGAYKIDTPQELSIYEVHVQDFTGDESWVSSQTPATPRGTYKAFVEPGTEITAYGDTASTGYDHLKDLGVKAVQLLPVFDHDNNEVGETIKYNWGYNPLNYNVPEGVYSTDPHNGYARVKEFRELVKALSETDVHTRTIMDVVYNHVSSATGSNFHKLMPRYYFRYSMQDYTYYWQEDGVTKSSTVTAGELWDGSGCHNEVASERPMMRKFIVDSLVHWAKDYKIKGFRFDLMGLIDFRTMIEVKKALHKVDKTIYIYGEGWTSGGYHGEGSYEYDTYYGKPAQSNYGAMTWQIYNECNNFRNGGVSDEIYLGGFNDTFRNAVRGENSVSGGYPGAGWIQNGTRYEDSSGWHNNYNALDNVAFGMWGLNYGVTGNGTEGNSDKTGRFPEQTVNYVSCHDNWTVRDQLFQTLSRDINDIARASLEAHALTFASNCAAFILGGEELFRTKEIPEADFEAVKKVAADSYRDLYGHHISHNSYNSPLSVNAFKWGNKIKVEIPAVTGIHDASSITNADAHYVEEFEKIVKMHTAANLGGFKRGQNISKCGDFVGSTTADATVLNIYWSTDDNHDNWSNAIGFQVNEHFVYAHTGGYSGGDNLPYIDPAFTWLSSYPDPLPGRNMYVVARRNH